MPSDVVVSDTKLVFSKIAVTHMGMYRCEASNSAGKDSEQINLVVNEPTDNGTPEQAPWIKTELSFVPVKKGADVNISCSYDGLPIPQAEWFFNGYKINMNEKRFQHTAQYAKRDSSSSITILRVQGITEDAFGDYMCRASNSLGMNQATIHVSGRPGPPVLELDNADLTWKVQSYEPVDEYRVYYRPETQDEWNKYETVRVSKADNDGSDKWEHTISLMPFLETGQKYQLQVKAKNALGYGSFAKDYVTIEIPTNIKEAISSSSRLFAISSLCTAIASLLLALLMV
ncbi:hypothetical protein WR25_04304 [Diploscapter pachys]|uniref:Ig-like domain-containing protein n=1 Tax=Diploscapter pachys TaxID=2018661 RepID=A0A2A2LDC4_9BILA|nr:hypothetical protein WR25_04304 [Diploscapter pachys]